MTDDFDTPEIQQMRYRMMIANKMLKEFKMEDDTIVVGHYTVLNCVKKGEVVLDDSNGITRRRTVFNITPKYVIFNDNKRMLKERRYGGNVSCYVEKFL